MTTATLTPPTVLPLATTTWDDAERQAMLAVMETGHYTMGKQVQAFEQAFAAMVGRRYAVMVNSGSSANLLMVAALCFRQQGEALQAGDEVLVPAVSWPTTYYPFSQYGLSLRFVDVDAATLNMDLAAMEAALTPRTRAVCAVNLLGNPNDFTALQAFCAKHKLILLEDNCESLGAVWQGQQAGTFGLMGTFSTFFSHHISTMEGGLVTTDDEELYHILLSLRSHGWTRQLPNPNTLCSKSDDPFEEAFRFILPGYNVRPGELHGAIGLEQLKKWPPMLAQRRANAKRFVEAMAEFDWVRPQAEVGDSSWFGFALMLQPHAPITRKQAVAHLQAQGIECRPIVAGNFAKNPVLRYLNHSISGQSLPAADAVDQHGWFVGNHHVPIDQGINALITSLRQLG
jgi:CDP-6-deoxy-D-xylo-4-hexulose-3-dehydrase